MTIDSQIDSQPTFQIDVCTFMALNLWYPYNRYEWCKAVGCDNLEFEKGVQTLQFYAYPANGKFSCWENGTV